MLLSTLSYLSSPRSSHAALSRPGQPPGIGLSQQVLQRPGTRSLRPSRMFSGDRGGGPAGRRRRSDRHHRAVCPSTAPPVGTMSVSDGTRLLVSHSNGSTDSRPLRICGYDTPSAAHADRRKLGEPIEVLRPDGRSTYHQACLPSFLPSTILLWSSRYRGVAGQMSSDLRDRRPPAHSCGHSRWSSGDVGKASFMVRGLPESLEVAGLVEK